MLVFFTNILNIFQCSLLLLSNIGESDASPLWLSHYSNYLSPDFKRHDCKDFQSSLVFFVAGHNTALYVHLCFFARRHLFYRRGDILGHTERHFLLNPRGSRNYQCAGVRSHPNLYYNQWIFPGMVLRLGGLLQHLSDGKSSIH